MISFDGSFASRESDDGSDHSIGYDLQFVELQSQPGYLLCNNFIFVLKYPNLSLKQSQ